MNKVCQLKSTIFVHDGKSVKGIGGAGKLTQNVYKGIPTAIHNSPGDICVSKKAVGVIWKHRSGVYSDGSTFDWCPLVTGVGNPDRNRLPDFLCKTINSIFIDFGSNSLLSTCTNGGTQNTNESFCNLVWEQCPKTIFVDRSCVQHNNRVQCGWCCMDIGVQKTSL